jgi:plastocyanin
MRAKINSALSLRSLAGAAAAVSFVSTLPDTRLTTPDALLTRDSRLATRDSRLATVTGHLTLLDKSDKQAEDVGQAVIWLMADKPVPAPPVRAEITTAEKQFSPHVLVVPVGSSISFPNHDPFNHNVFSLSEENPFDLGLYGRGETPAVKFARAGIVRVYCNVHSQMSALVVVRDNPWYTQPASDGSFTISAVPPGRYTLHAWHERSPAVSRPIEVPAAGLPKLDLQLDARGYQFKPHLNKFGRPYSQQGRRY